MAVSTSLPHQLKPSACLRRIRPLTFAQNCIKFFLTKHWLAVQKTQWHPKMALAEKSVSGSNPVHSPLNEQKTKGKTRHGQTKIQQFARRKPLRAMRQTNPDSRVD
jgi:hypothetical protein